jgi:hypothetical protein
MGLGGLHTVDLARARLLARECRSLLLEGKDPIEARKAVRLADALQRPRLMTFDQCAAAYIDAHRSCWKNAKHAEQWKNMLATYASPVIGVLPVAHVDTDLIVKVLSPKWGVRTETATRLRGRIESILDWATVSQFRQGDNPALARAPGKPARQSKQDRTNQESSRAALARGPCVHGGTREVRRRCGARGRICDPYGDALGRGTRRHMG